MHYECNLKWYVRRAELFQLFFSSSFFVQICMKVFFHFHRSVNFIRSKFSSNRVSQGKKNGNLNFYQSKQKELAINISSLKTHENISIVFMKYAIPCTLLYTVEVFGHKNCFRHGVCLCWRMATEKGMMRNIFVRLCQISEIQNSKVQYAYGFVWTHGCVCGCVTFRKGKVHQWTGPNLSTQWSRLSNAYDRQYNSRINTHMNLMIKLTMQRIEELLWFEAFSNMNVVISIWSKWVTVQCANLRVVNSSASNGLGTLECWASLSALVSTLSP